MKNKFAWLFACLSCAAFTAAYLFKTPPADIAREPSSVQVPDTFFVQDLDKELGEKFEEGDFAKEKKYITNVVNTFVKFIQDVHAKTPTDATHRGAHAKALACLKASFEVDNGNLPENLRVGLFAKNQSYKTWIRVSNSSQDPFSKDKDQNTRGFAMKLLGVEGPKLIDPSQASSTMDLLTVAAEAFVAKDNSNYSKISEGESPSELFFRLGLFRALGLVATVKKAQGEQNPLRLDYFSTVPYRLGPAAGPKKAIKFKLNLCEGTDGAKFPAAKDGAENLMKNIIDTIEVTGSVCLDFKVQFADSGDDVEDATTKWPGEYYTVAHVKIDKTENSASRLSERKDLCENMSFNPWRTLEVHRPLGRINRARKTTYLMSSTFRHDSNRVPMAEPTVDSFASQP